ncbi:MAG: hypothetical protein IPG93_23210 [Burkholderiales bacterium]|nr:hypothetical protein [Burkholderiales bacterium]
MATSLRDQVALAAEQLDTAIEMFLAERSDVSALTLAGAAEEILGRVVKLAGSQNAIRQAYEASALTHRCLQGMDLKWQDFADGENYARNAAKHLLHEDKRHIELDLRRAAMWMVVRACANYERLDLVRTDRMRDFDNWFFDHEVGV